MERRQYNTLTVLTGINYYEDFEWMGGLPEGVLNTSTSRRSSRSQPHQSHDTDGQQAVDAQESTEGRVPVRDRIVEKWHSLKKFCCRRHDSMQFEHPDDVDANRSSTVFTISGHVPPPTTHQLSVDERGSRDNDINLSQTRSQVVAGKIDSSATARRDSGSDTPQIIFGRERPQVLDLLRRRTTQLYIFLKQKFHTRSLNIDSSLGQDSTTDVQPHLQTVTNTYASVANTSSLTDDPDFSSTNLNVWTRQRRYSESAERDNDNPVQNLVLKYIGTSDFVR